MPPSPGRDSNDDPEDVYIIDEDAPVITLDNNETGFQEAMEDLDFEEDDDEENGYLADDSSLVFDKHNGSVFSVDTANNDGNVAISGGEDDRGFVWRCDTGEVLYECDGHKDSVISCGFSSDDKYIMTADMSGVVIVRSYSDGEIVWDFECSDIEWCKWHFTAHVVLAGTTDGDVYMWKIPSGECKIYAGHGSKTTVGCLLSTGKDLVVGYEDGTLKVWCLKLATSVFSVVQNAGDSLICVASQKSNRLFACGTAVGKTNIYSAESYKHVASLQLDSEENCNIESIVFSTSSYDHIACASLAGNISVWDIPTQRLRYNCKHSCGFSRIIWTETNILIAASLGGEIRIYDGRNGEFLRQFNGHSNSVLDFALNSEKKSLITVSDDQTARVFEL